MRFRILLLFLIIGYTGYSQMEVYDSIIAQDLSYVTTSKQIDSLSKTTLDSTQLATILHHYASFAYGNSDLNKAIRLLNQAVKIRENLRDTLELKKSLFNLGFFYRRANDVALSMTTYRLLVSKGKEDRYHAKAYTELAFINSMLGDFHRALLYHRKAEAILKKTGDIRSLYKNYMQLSRVYAIMDRETYSTQIIQTLAKVDSLSSFIQIDNSDKIIKKQRLGAVYDELEQYDIAIAYYKELLQEEDLELKCITLNNLAVSESNAGNREHARLHLNMALNHAQHAHETAMVSNNLGDWFLSQNSYDSAQFYYEQSIKLYISGNSVIDVNRLDMEQITNSPYLVPLLQSLISMGDFWWSMYEESNSKESIYENLRYLKLADELLEHLRFESNEQLSKLFWRAQASEIHIKAVRACFELQDLDAAYHFMERNKAILLLENINLTQAKINANLPTNLADKEITWRTEINSALQEHYLQNTSETEDVVSRLKFQFEGFMDSVFTQYPAYAKYLTKIPILDLTSHKSAILDNEVASLQFIMNETLCFGFLNTLDTSYLYKIDSKSLTSQVNMLQQLNQKSLQTAKELDDFLKCSYEVYKLVFKPIESILNKSIRLIVVSDGLLHNINFEALSTTSKIEDVKNSFLIQNFEVKYAYSFSHLATTKEIYRSNNNEFLIISPGTFNDMNLTSLPQSLKESKQISELVSGDGFFEEDAILSKFINSFPDYSVVHLATHAQFSSDSMQIHFFDRSLSIQEIYALQNSANLIVLNACGTSKGEMAQGEGVMSLARGFFFSGSNNVISTLGNVNDGVSSHIMTAFYSHLKDGFHSTSALRQAKLNYLSSAKGSEISPYYWGAFIHIGDGYSFQPPFRYSLLIGLLLLILLPAIVIVYRRIRN